MHWPGRQEKNRELLNFNFLFGQRGKLQVTMQSSSAEVTMMESQNRKRAPAWTEQEGMKDRGHNRDPKQCRVKLKELRQAYQKTREANNRRAQMNAWRQTMSECRKAQNDREERWRAEDERWQQCDERKQDSMLRLLEDQINMLQGIVELQERQQEHRLLLQPLCNQLPSSPSSIASTPRRPRTIAQARRLAFDKF
ncbi:hypothetical protein UY3_05022 [Chelonia mydas]|uniref:Uncharacterized protein n=1 Tax=Chelonia mydas TaxID=8469 RepID=M7BKK4_CHEMY|nr:hypothetical protein UY3_05022 [Chelonia mydas]